MCEYFLFWQSQELASACGDYKVNLLSTFLGELWFLIRSNWFANQGTGYAVEIWHAQGACRILSSHTCDGGTLTGCYPAVHTCHEWSMPARSTQISNIPQHAWCKTLMASVVRLYLCGRKRPYHWQSYRVTSNAKRQFWLYGRRIELFVANAQEKQLSWVQFYLKITTTEMSRDVTYCKANIDSYMTKQQSVHERTWHTIDLRCESMGPITPLKTLL